MCFISVSLHLCFCVFPDPTLTPENLSTVLDSMDDFLWRLFSRYVNVPESEVAKIKGQYSSDRECKQAVVPHIISTHPILSWRLVANALYQMVTDWRVVGGDSCNKALDRLQQMFPTGLNTTYTSSISCE